MTNITLRNILYASPAFAFAIPTFPVMIILPALYSEKYGYDLSDIGIYLFLAKLIDIVSDPIMGWVNDKSFFSRKYWLIFGGLISGFALKKLFVLEFIPYEHYLLIWVGLLYLGWTMFQIPYLSIGYDLERNYFLRTKLSASREFFILLGLFFSLGLPMIFEFNSGELAEYLVYVAVLSGFIGILLICFFVPTENTQKKENKNFFLTLRNLKKNKSLIRLMAIFLINSLANVLPMILFAFFVTYVLGGNDFDRQRVLFFYFLFAILGIPFWTLLSKKINKNHTWAVSLSLSSLFFVFVLFLDSGDLFCFIIISCLTGFCLGADLIIPPSIQADITDIHKYKFKEDISGLLFSFITFINKISFALMSLFVFGVLGILDFDTNQAINNESKRFIFFSYAFLPVVLKLISGFLLINFKSNQNEQVKIQKKIYG